MVFMRFPSIKVLQLGEVLRIDVAGQERRDRRNGSVVFNDLRMSGEIAAMAHAPRV